MLNDRQEYQLTDEEYAALLAASRPTRVMYLSGGMPMFGSQQENANRAWAKIGTARGFDAMTVQPSSKGDRFFTAVPCGNAEDSKP